MNDEQLCQHSPAPNDQGGWSCTKCGVGWRPTDPMVPRKIWAGTWAALAMREFRLVLEEEHGDFELAMEVAIATVTHVIALTAARSPEWAAGWSTLLGVDDEEDEAVINEALNKLPPPVLSDG